MKTMSVPGSLYSVSPAEYHAKSLSPPTPMGASGPSFGPLMNPSIETESPVRTLPISVSLPVLIICARFAARNSGDRHGPVVDDESEGSAATAPTFWPVALWERSRTRRGAYRRRRGERRPDANDRAE